jgi:hypothetical protein
MIMPAKIVALGRLSPRRRTSWWSEVMDRVVDRPRARLMRPFALAVMAACLTSADASLAKPPEAGAERIRLFEWFRTLGFPDVKHAKFVRYPASASQSRGQPPAVSYGHGFLLDENKSEWTILSFGLKRTSKDKKPYFSATPPGKWTCQEQDLAAFAKTTLASQANAESAISSESSGEDRLKTTKVFFLAWACWRQGLDEQATKLFELAANLKDGPSGVAPGLATLHRRIAADLAHEEFIEAQLGLVDDKTPREKVLARLEALSKKYPGLETSFLAGEMARVLRKMVPEDREHAKLEKLRKPFAERSRQEQIAELIFELRDQHGGSVGSWDEREDIFLDYRQRDESPAERLFKIGYEGVPQLIDSLSDERFSRTIGFHWKFGQPRLNFRYHVLTVGDCALQILERLAGREFFKRSDSYMSEWPIVLAEVKSEVLKWNVRLQRDLKEKGERQVLMDAVQKADWESTYLIEPLKAKYADAVLPALAAASRKATDKIVLRQLVELMDRTGGKELIPILLKELKTSPSLDQRVAVATLLLKHNRSDGTVPLIEEWKKSATGSLPSDALVELAFYLGKCGNRDAVAALAHGLDTRPASIRLAVVRSFGSNESMGGSGSGGKNFDVLFHDGFGREPQMPVNLNDKLLVAAVADLLIEELTDTEQVGNISGQWGDVKFRDPRIADISGHVLHQLDGRRFAFNLSADVPERDRQRVATINAWRKSRNLPKLALPKPRVIAPIAEETLAPLLNRLQHANAGARDAAERDLEKLGPGAVAGILKRRDQLNPADPLRKDLERLARRLAHTIVEVQFADRSLKPTGKFAARLEALKYKSLDTATLVDLTVGLTSEMTLPVHGCRLYAFRAGPGSGVVLRVDLLDKERNNALNDVSGSRTLPRRPNGPVWWHESLTADSNGQPIFGVSGGGIEVDRSMLQMLGNSAFAIDLSKPLEINIEYVGHWIE